MGLLFRPALPVIFLRRTMREGRSHPHFLPHRTDALSEIETDDGGTLLDKPAFAVTGHNYSALRERS